MRQKNMSTALKKVKALGYFDLTLTVLTLIVVGYGVILPYSGLLPQSSNTLLPKNLKRMEDPFLFWVPVAFFGTIGLIGVLWSLVLIKTSGLEVKNLIKTRLK